MKKLITYMPKYYKKIEEITKLQEAIESEIDATELLKSVLNQKFVQWSLETWEKIFELTTDLTLSNESRRENIIAKMQAGKTTTIKMLKTMAEVFSGGECDVI